MEKVAKNDPFWSLCTDLQKKTKRAKTKIPSNKVALGPPFSMPFYKILDYVPTIDAKCTNVQKICKNCRKSAKKHKKAQKKFFQQKSSYVRAIS